MRVALLMALLLCTTPISAADVKTKIQFLSRAEASAALTHGAGGAYYAGLQLADMRAKTGLPLKDMGLVAAREATKQAYAAATEDFTEGERGALREAIDAMQPVLLARAPLYARTPWSFIKMKATIEGGLSETRGDSIVLSDSKLRAIVSNHNGRFDQPSELWSFLLHEQTHVLQRKYPGLFVGLYTGFFGFRHAEVTPPDWLRTRSAVDPDAPVADWIYPMGKAAARHWVLPFIELSELDHPKMPADFKMVALALHQVKGGHWAIDDVKLPAAQLDLDNLPGYLDAFPVKGLAFHPNEIAAEMLAEIIYGGPRKNPEHALWPKTKVWADTALR